MKRTWLLVVFVACGGSGERAPVPRDATIATAHDAAPDAAHRGFVGVIAAAEAADVAPRFEGVIARVHVRAGDQLRADELVAEMDPAPLRDELRTAQAALATADAATRQAAVDVDGARAQVEIERVAVAVGTSPKQTLEQAELALKRAEAAAQRAASTAAAERSRVSTARSRLSDTALRAPFAGTVAMRYHDAGSTVPAGTPIVRLVAMGALRLRFAVPPERAAGLVAGVIVTASIETVATVVPATIRQVSPALDPASGMVIFEAEISPDPDLFASLRPGLAASVSSP